MGAGGEGIPECFTLSGWMKIIESFCIFTLIMVHRIGDYLNQVFFGATDRYLDIADTTYPAEADTEILGSGTLLCFIIVTPMILLAYAVEGRKAVQASSLDALFSFTGACMLIATGGMTCFAFNNANTNISQSTLNRRDMELGGTLGIMSIITGLLYLGDFFYTMYQNALLRNSNDW